MIVLLVLAIPASKRIRRRLTLVRARGPQELVLAAYSVLTHQADDLGWGRRASETMWEYRQRLKTEVSALNGDLDTLTRLAGRAAYSFDGVDAAVADDAVRAARRVVADLRRSTGRGRRLAGWFRLERPGAYRQEV
jgi:hypothetical protein